jgi:hypothetical protein
MTAYFDALRSQLRDEQTPKDDVGFVAFIAALEQQVIADVVCCVEDAEFPADLAAKAKRIIDVLPVTGERGRDHALFCRESELIDAFHSMFHDLAGRHLKARFGWWSDSPGGNVKRILSHAQGD